jgi:hypothetical protein
MEVSLIIEKLGNRAVRRSREACRDIPSASLGTIVHWSIERM